MTCLYLAYIGFTVVPWGVLNVKFPGFTAVPRYHGLDVSM